MSDARWGDPREYGERHRGDERPRVYDERDRDDHDPRDALMHDLDLPRGEERELVVDRDRVYELNGEASRTLAAVGTFRVVPEQDLDTDHDTLGYLRDEDLVETVDFGIDERGLVLTKEGCDLLDSYTLERDDRAPQAFHAGVSRPREIDHDSNLYATYGQEETRLRDAHGDLEIRRVILEQDLKREYQEFLQDHNRDHSDSDGRPDRSEDEIRDWAREHDLPYFASVPHGTSSVRLKGQRRAHPADAHRARHRAHSPHFAAVVPARMRAANIVTSRRASSSGPCADRGGVHQGFRPGLV